MKLESNWFDNQLKKTIYHDLLYRAFLWTVFPLVILCINMYLINYSAIEYIKSAYNSIVPILNCIFPVSSILVIVALFTKHSEGIADISKNKEIIFHVYRRFTSDVLIWICGAVINLTLITVINFGIVFYEDTNEITIKNLFLTTFLLFIFTVIIAYCICSFILIRREKSLSFKNPLFNKGWFVNVFYFIVLVIWYAYIWH